jgi:AcrR family transcriptional regulator
MTTSEHRDGDLPHGLEVLWELREKAQRGSREGLSVERIVAAAIASADEDGLASLSMARVAKRLDFATMSLYRHVSSKDELQMLMVDVAYGTPPVLTETGDQWRAGLEKWARAFLEVFRAHPWMLQITVAGPPLEPGQLSWLECGLRTLGGTGLRPDEKLSVMLLMIGYVRTNAQLFGSSPAVGDEDAADADLMASYGKMLANIVARDAFPALSELIEAHTFDEPKDDFGFGLERVLDGIDALVRSRVTQ